MKNFTFLKKQALLFAVFLASSFSFAQTLDQSNTIISASTSGTSIGQSFTPGLTGKLSKFIYFNNLVSSNTYPLNFKLKIYQGGGNTGTLLGEQSFTLTSTTPNGEFEIVISNIINVTAGNLYTAYFIPDDGTSVILFSSTAANSYSGGSLYNGNSPFVSGDLYFKTFVTVPATHLNFDGVDDYVQVPAGINLANSSFTVEFMAKRTATNVNNYVLKQGNQVNNDLLHIGFRDNNNFTFAFWYNDINIPVSNYVADTNWHHWSCVYNNVNGTRQVYQDGVLVASDSGVSPYTGSGVIQIGSFNGTTYFYNGGIDDVRIWNIVRTAEQISGSRNCELQGTEAGLVAYYKFNQGIDAADNTAITSLIDATAAVNNGTLVNFTKTGTTSNFLAGSPVTTGSVIPSVATVTTPVTYNQGATATALTATTGTNGTGLVWYTTAAGGTGTTTAPTPSTATIGSTSYWVSSNNANGCESERTEIVVTVNALATHLNFDGVNNRVELPNESNFDFTSTFSMEAWIRVTSFTVDWQTVISKGAEGPRIHRFGGSNFIAFGTGPGDDLASTVSVNDGNWHHIAATCNNGFKSLYVDGVLQGTQTVGTPLVTNNDNVRIGSQIDSYSPIRAFHGDIDEVRFWNVARTAEQVSGSSNCELQGTETGLIAYYNFNQGIDAADNTAITTLIDATTNTNNGTLVNFTKTGVVSNFLAGSPVTTGSIVPSVATVTTPVTYNQGATATALTATTGTNGTGLVWYTTAAGGTGTTTAPTPSTATAGSTSYWVSSTNANGCESARTEIVVTVNALATHLNFDGVNDYVQIPKTFNSDFTIEFWVKTTSTSSTGTQWYNGKSIVDNEVAGVTSDFGTALVGSKLAFGIGSPDVTIFSTSNINNGNWNHIAVSWKQSSGEMKLYVNGVNESSGTGSTNQRTASNSIKLATNNYLGNYFNGDIDEVRIWNRLLPLAEIQNNMNCELPSPSTQNGLVAYYQFNQGFDSADNTSITTLTDASGNANNGTLTNFALTGSTSNFLAGSPIVTGTNCTVLSNESFEVANNIKMYPNPTNNIVVVEVYDLTNAKLQVVDITGKILMNQALNISSNTVNVAQLPTGMYFFKVTSNEGTTTNKIIKN